MKFYVVRESTNEVILTLYRDTPLEASAYVGE